MSAQVQTLESQTLMSASAATVDQAQVKADLARFRADALAGTATLLRDAAAFKGQHLAAATTVTPLVTKLRADVTATHATLRGDRAVQSAAVTADRAQLVIELEQLRADRHDATAVATDRAVIRTTWAKLEDDAVAGLTTRITARTTATAAIFNDVTAIEAAAATDPNATDGLRSAIHQFGADYTARLATLTADRAKVSADRARLSADLTADA